MSLDTKTLVDNAEALGLATELGGGRVRIEGRICDVKRAFALQGCDLVPQGTTGHAVYLGDHHGPATFVATICSTERSYAYGYTCSH